jgi:hypothetical protein
MALSFQGQEEPTGKLVFLAGYLSDKVDGSTDRTLLVDLSGVLDSGTNAWMDHELKTVLTGDLLDELLLPEDFLFHERRPRWHFFGHVHSGCGRRGRYINGCYPHSMEFFDSDDGKRQVARIAAQVAVPDPRWS